jgi:hypothetical protein
METTSDVKNDLIILQNKIRALEQENESLKQKIELMYSNWTYDYTRFTELKERFKLTES